MSINSDGTYNFQNESIETKKEIEIRGRYLMMACDIEFSLLNIIMFCSENPYNQKRLGQFTDMKMNEKILNAIRDLKNYNMSYYNEFKSVFEGLEEFRIIRNDMAHCIGMFPNSPNLDVFKIDFIQKEDKKDKENKNEWFASKSYSEGFINESINRFSIINSRLAFLFLRLKREFEISSKSHPFIYPSSFTGL